MDAIYSFILSTWAHYPWAMSGVAIALALLAIARPKEFGQLLLVVAAILVVVYVVSAMLDTVRRGSEGREQLTRDPHVQVEPGDR